MGCFDSVCSFSKLPVHYGNDIVVQYVYGGQIGRSEYSWGQFGFPIFGKYNDYGDIEDVDTSHINYDILKRNVDVVKNYVPIMERSHLEDDDAPLVERFMANVVAGEQMIHSLMECKGQFEESDWCKGRMKIKEHTGTSVMKCFFHRKVYDKVVAIGKSMYNDPEGYYDDSFTLPTPELITEYTKLRSTWKDSPAMRFSIHSSDRGNIFEDGDPLRWIDRIFSFSENDCYPRTHTSSVSMLNKMVDELLPELTLEHPFTQALLDQKYFRMGRIALNLELVPHFTFSCQQYYEPSDIDRMMTFHATIGEVANDLHKNRYSD